MVLDDRVDLNRHLARMMRASGFGAEAPLWGSFDRSRGRPSVEFSEVEWTLDDRPIRQGDVLSFPAATEPWDQLGVIVTADCDIVWEKHQGRFSYVPILPATYYLSNFYLHKHLERLSASLGEHVVERIHALQRANLPEFSTPLSGERALEWLLDHGPEWVANSLQAAGPPRAEFVTEAKMYLCCPARPRCGVRGAVDDDLRGPDAPGAGQVGGEGE
jgi:hypothetical protein